MLYAGIDLHKHYVHIAVINNAGNTVAEARLNNDRKIISNFFGRFDEPIKAVVEATLNWYWLVDLLDELQYSICLAHPAKLKAIVTAKCEDDKISSMMLAQLLRTDLIPAVYVFTPELRALRDLCRTRSFLVHQRTAIVNNCHSTLLKYNILAPATSKLYSNDGLAFLKNPELQLHELFKFGLTCKSNLLNELNEMIKHLEKKIRQNCIEDSILKLLKTISGIGDVLAPTIRYEIGDISRFKSAKKLSSYCRYTPKMHISGKTTKYYRTSKQGNAYLKWAFSEATTLAIRYDKDVRHRYQKLLTKKGKPVALSIIGRNLTTVVYNVWMNQQPYRGFKVPKEQN